MKKHLLLVCVAFMYFGFGNAVRLWGIAAGLGLWPTITIFTTSVIFFVVVMFTAMERVKEKLYKEDEIKFDFEKENKKQTP